MDILHTYNGGSCEHCGAKTIDGCLICGAPQCCPQCCAISTAEAERDELRGRLEEIYQMSYHDSLRNDDEYGTQAKILLSRIRIKLAKGNKRGIVISGDPILQPDSGKDGG